MMCLKAACLACRGAEAAHPPVLSRLVTLMIA